jgi:hypothetical protein
VASTSFSIDGGTAQTYTAPFTISADGTHTVSFSSTDVAGNAELSKTVTVKIDQTAPVTTPTAAHGVLPPGVPLLSVNATATIKSTAGITLGTVGPVQCFDTAGLVIKLNAVDNAGGSGVAKITYAATGANPLSGASNGASAQISINLPGMTTLTFHATDVAGNQEPTKSESAVIVGVGEDGIGYGCAMPTVTFTPPAHGTAAVQGTVTFNGLVFPFSKNITY